MRAKPIFLVLATCAGLAACGDTMGEQALYGAGAGLAGSAILDTDPVLGVAAGAAANVLYCREHPGKC